MLLKVNIDTNVVPAGNIWSLAVQWSVAAHWVVQ